MQAEAAGIAIRIAAVPAGAIDQQAVAHRLFGARDAQALRRLAVQRQLLNLPSHTEVVGVFAQQAPAAELGHEPHAVGQVRQVGPALVEQAQGVRVLPVVAQAILIEAEQTWLDAVQRGIQVRVAAKQLRSAATVFGALLDEPAGGEDRFDERAGAVGVLFGEGARTRQHLFRMVWPYRLAGGQRKALALGHSIGGPRFAHAETVDAPRLDMRGHLGRRHHYAVHVAQRVDALAGQPVIQPHGVGAGGEGLGEGQACAMLVHQARQCFRVGHAFALQGRGEVDGLRVLVQPHEHGHVTGRYATDAQVHGIDQAIQAVRGIQLAADQLVAQPGPGALALEVEGKAVLLGEALGGGDHHRGAVGQGHIADVQAGLFRRVTAIDPGQGRCSGYGVHKVPRLY